MKVGILELVSIPPPNPLNFIYYALFSKQYASITPQVISVWCRQLGHESHYVTYYGFGDLRKCLPDDVDIVFISCCSQFALLAYRLAKLYREKGIRTVIGGPHAKSFPQDCLRFFDLAIKNLDKDLLKDILANHFEPNSFVSSKQSYQGIPTVEEREPEIRTASYFARRWRSPIATTVPIMSSMGCPYTCNFCSDWDNPYRALPAKQLVTDIQFIAKHMPGTMVGFADPNFAVKFDYTLSALESIPTEQRMPYIMECSLSLINEERLERLQNTGCLAALFGIESWSEYTNKSGVSRKKTSQEKLTKLIETFAQIKEKLSYLQANFIFGVDSDSGEEPVELTKEFMRQVPYAWPVLNIPVPFGGTPLQETMLQEGRVLTAMPFIFYYTPHLVMRPKNYEPIDYIEKMLDLSEYATSSEMQKLRSQSTHSFLHKISHRIRNLEASGLNLQYRKVLQLMRSDQTFLAFHEGRSDTLPDYYRQQCAKLLGKYTGLLSDNDIKPDLTPRQPTIV